VTSSRFQAIQSWWPQRFAGAQFARRGNLTTRKDTINETFSHDLTAVARPGEELTVAVRVQDWSGAGGIFRPVTLATTPWAPELEAFQ